LPGLADALLNRILPIRFPAENAAGHPIQRLLHGEYLLGEVFSSHGSSHFAALGGGESTLYPTDEFHALLVHRNWKKVHNFLKNFLCSSYHRKTFLPRRRKLGAGGNLLSF
jgi:hypothetical protein